MDEWSCLRKKKSPVWCHFEGTKKETSVENVLWLNTYSFQILIYVSVVYFDMCAARWQCGYLYHVSCSVVSVGQLSLAADTVCL